MLEQVFLPLAFYLENVSSRKNLFRKLFVIKAFIHYTYRQGSPEGVGWRWGCTPSGMFENWTPPQIFPKFLPGKLSFLIFFVDFFSERQIISF
jgi:hypothetical protein